VSTPGRRDEVRAGLQVSVRLPVAQSYLERRPSQALAGLSSVWIQQASPGTAPFTHRNIPNGSVEFLCEVGSVPQIVGPRTRPRVEVLPPGSNVVGIRFRPGAAVSVLGVPLRSLPVSHCTRRICGVGLRLFPRPRERTCSLRTVRWRGVRPGVRRGREDRSGAVRSHGHQLCPIRRAAARAHNWKIWRDIQRSRPTLTVANIRRYARQPVRGAPPSCSLYVADIHGPDHRRPQIAIAAEAHGCQKGPKVPSPPGAHATPPCPGCNACLPVFAAVPCQFLAFLPGRCGQILLPSRCHKDQDPTAVSGDRVPDLLFPGSGGGI
jgi:hypothetical protein